MLTHAARSTDRKAGLSTCPPHVLLTDISGDAMRNDFYVYTHKRKTDGLVFYVGKGSGGRANLMVRRNPHWGNVAEKHGVEVVLYEVNLTEKEAFQSEVNAIKSFRAKGHPLTNMTEGGEGPCGARHSDLTRIKMSKERLGKKKPENFGKRIAQLNALRFLNPEYRKRQSDIRIGNKLSDETKRKIALKATGRKLSQSGKEKTIEAIKERSARLEFREKLSASSTRKRPVECSNGMVFESAIAATKWLQGLGHTKASPNSLTRVCKGKCQTCYGFGWIYYQPEKQEG